MKKNLLTLVSIFTVLFITTNVHATLLFQGSSTLSTTITQSPSQARAAWEAQLQSFSIDNLNSLSGSSPFTSSIGNIFSATNNGSSITSNGSEIRGNRSSADFIQFDVLFPNPVNAVGFDVRDNDGGGMQLSLTNSVTNVVTTFNFNSVAGSQRTEFFGVIFDSTTFISSLRVGGTDPGGITYWDDFTTGVGENAVVVGVPEPTTLAIFGLAMITLVSRRLNKNS